MSAKVNMAQGFLVFIAIATSGILLCLILRKKSNNIYHKFREIVVKLDIMTQDNKRKHDELAKSYLAQDVTTAKNFLQIYLPPEILAKCDLESIFIENTSYIEEDLRTNFSDVVYRLNFKNKIQTDCMYVHVLVEHQSSAERLMPLRIIGYQLAIIRKYLVENSKSSRRKVKLPLVIPFVFYHGKTSPYPYPCEIGDLFADKNFYTKFPLGTFNLIDLTIKSDDELLQHGTLSLLEIIGKHINMRNAIVDISAIIKALQVAHKSAITEALANATFSYLFEALETEVAQLLIKEIKKQIPYYGGNAMNYAEYLRQEGRQEGKQEGRQEGRQEGQQEGRQEGRQEEKILVAQSMLELGVELNIILKATGLSLSDIKKIKNKTTNH